MRNRLRVLPTAALSALSALTLGLAACGDTEGADETASDAATAGDNGEAAQEVEGVNFTVDGAGYTCWSGGPSAVFCVGPGPWVPEAPEGTEGSEGAEGDAAAYAVMFDIRNQTTALLPGGVDLSTLNLEDVDRGTVDVAGVTYDVTDPARMTFTHNELGATGFISADDYGWL